MSFDFLKGFVLDFNPADGLSQGAKSTKRYLSNMKGMYYDETAYEKALAEGDKLIYEFYELGAPETPGDLAFGTSITYPGCVGDEYYMTKGHFHSIVDTAEVYYCLSGRGYMLTENADGEWTAAELTAGKAVYVPRGFAHRSINVGDEPFVTFFVFRGDAGHDYGTIEAKGFRHLLINCDGKEKIIENPKWK